MKLVFSFLFIIILLFLKTDFWGPDYPIYYAYTESVIQDGDLNPVNRIGEHYTYVLLDGTVGISPTYNLPSHHNHGGVILWAPFYLCAEAVSFIDRKAGLGLFPDDPGGALNKAALSFSTAVFGFLALVMSYLLARLFFPPGASLLSVVAVFFGTPVSYFTVGETGNANIAAMLFTVFTLWFLLYAALSRKEILWFLLGVFFGIAMAVKVDVWFLLLIIGVVFLWLLYHKRTTWKMGCFFIAGIIPPLFFKTVNDFIKYGRLHMGEFGVLNLKDNYLIEQLFSPHRGIFYTSPLLYICFAGIIIVFIKHLRDSKLPGQTRPDNLIILLLCIYVITKTFIISNRFGWGGGTLGPRPLVSDFPVLVLLYGTLFSFFKSRYVRAGIILISGVFIAWNFMVILEFITGLDLKYIPGAPPLQERGANLFFLWSEIAEKCFPAGEPINLRKGFLLLPVLLPVLYTSFKFLDNSGKTGSSPLFLQTCKFPFSGKFFTIITLFLFFSYGTVTFLNVVNNRENVLRLKEEGFFDHRFFILNPGEYEKAENLTTMIEMIYVFKGKGDMQRVRRIEQNIKSIYGEGIMEYYRWYYNRYEEILKKHRIPALPG